MNARHLCHGLLLALSLVGCSKSTPDDLGKPFDELRTGMSVADADRLLGKGEDIPKGQLPGNFLKVYAPEDSVTYRKWVRRAGDSHATVYAAVKDGKLTAARLIDKVIVEGGGS